MRTPPGFVTIVICLLTACSGNGKTAGSGVVCCSAADDAGLALCACQAPGTVSQGGFTSTLTVSGSSCTTTTTLQGRTSSSTGSVVASCDNIDAGPLSGEPDSSATADGTTSDAGCVSRPDGIVGWWRGDGDFTDSIGTNSGSSAGGVTFTPGQVGQGFALSGQPNSYVVVPDSPSLELTGPMTIDAWINPTVLGGRIVDKIQAGGADGYMLDTYLGQLRLIVGVDILRSPTSLPMGTFTHVAGVYDLKSLAVYINGAVAATMPALVGFMPTNQLPLHIGADSNGASRFTGVIDEVRIFRRALSAGEIQTSFQQGASARCP